jgi:hypothetical protein
MGLQTNFIDISLGLPAVMTLFLCQLVEDLQLDPTATGWIFFMGKVMENRMETWKLSVLDDWS